jgi:hypothetical protein
MSQLYVWAYFSLIMPTSQICWNEVSRHTEKVGHRTTTYILLRKEMGVVPKYRIGDEYATEFFRPIHNLDRVARPKFWRPDQH